MHSAARTQEMLTSESARWALRACQARPTAMRGESGLIAALMLAEAARIVVVAGVADAAAAGAVATGARQLTAAATKIAVRCVTLTRSDG
jgi:hypothetical protein